MGMLKDAFGPAFGVGQVNNGLNGPMSKIKGAFSKNNAASSPAPQYPTRLPPSPSNQYDNRDPRQPQQDMQSPDRLSYQKGRLPRAQSFEESLDDGRLSPRSRSQGANNDDASSDSPPPYGAQMDGGNMPTNPQLGGDRHRTLSLYHGYHEAPRPRSQSEGYDLPPRPRPQFDGETQYRPNAYSQPRDDQFLSSSYSPRIQSSDFGPSALFQVAYGYGNDRASCRGRRARRARGAGGAVQPINPWSQHGPSGAERAYRPRRQ